jgi:hypothetical protein
VAKAADLAPYGGGYSGGYEPPYTAGRRVVEERRVFEERREVRPQVRRRESFNFGIQIPLPEVFVSEPVPPCGPCGCR